MTDSRAGTCTVAVVMPEDNFSVNSMLVETRKLNAKADSLRVTCVENQNSGGIFHGVEECNFHQVIVPLEGVQLMGR